MKDEYPDSKSDLFAGFIERVVAMVKPHGYMAQVTMQSWMFLSSYERLRSKLQHDAAIVAVLHMDNMVMRIAFGTSATVWEIHGDARRAGKYTWFTPDDLDGDAPRMFPARNARNATAGADGYFTVPQSEMAAIPGSPIVYWLSEKMRAAFKSGEPLGRVAELRQGLKTANNDRFLREWWEVSESRTGFNCSSRAHAEMSGARWFPYNKGGEFRRWYGNQEFVVNWEHDGAELRAFGTEDGGRPKSRVQATEFYFRPSISWPEVSSGVAAFRAFPVGFIFDSTGSSGFSDNSRRMAALLAIANSSATSGLLEAVAPGLRFDVGQVAKIPVLESVVTDSTVERTESLVSTACCDWDTAETSWDFGTSPLVALLDDD